MYVAVAVDHQQIAQHFGHASEYRVYRLEDQRILGVETLINPGHRPGFLPGFLKDHGVDVMITGGMGESALKLFAAKDVIVITGVRGNPDVAIQRYLTNDLIPQADPCGHQHHEHHGHS